MAASRSEVLYMQRVFKTCLDAMSRPGTVATMPSSLNKEVRYLGMTPSLGLLIDSFVDQATSIALISASDKQDEKEDPNIQLSDYHLEQVVMAETHARLKPADQAAFIAVLNSADDVQVTQAVLAAYGGTFVSPETGATLFIECESLALKGEEDSGLTWLSVKGPGVKDEQVFGIDRISWLHARSQRSDEFPCGVDIILTNTSGRVVAIPRTSLVSCVHEDNCLEAN